MKLEDKIPVTYLIVDDEAAARDNLKAKLDTLFTDQIICIGIVDSVKSASEKISVHNPNIIFLDITMPNQDGFKLLDLEEVNNCEVIFVTAHNEYAMKAFDYCATGYILKPIDNEMLKSTVEKAIKRVKIANSNDLLSNFKTFVSQGMEHARIAVTTHSEIELFDPDFILIVEASEGYCKFTLKNGRTIISSKRFTYYSSLLQSSLFVKTHRSFIVNKNYISKIDKNNLVAYIGEAYKVPIAKSKKEEVFNNFVS